MGNVPHFGLPSPESGARTKVEGALRPSSFELLLILVTYRLGMLRSISDIVGTFKEPLGVAEGDQPQDFFPLSISKSWLLKIRR